VNLLLDTHALLWWLADARDLEPAAREAIGDPETLVYVSAVSVWEIVIKKALGKLEVPDDLPAVVEAEPFQHLDITIEHAFKVSELPMHHSDPFDRLLIAQCLVDGLTLVTHDADIARYDVPTLAT
jgi:PIN domain nuclease of toxin-antitoxin system